MSKQAKYNPKFGYDIRVKPPSKQKKKEPATHICAWAGCKEKAPYRAPKDKKHLNEYQYFCMDHIREFNANWNFFEGMDDDAVQDFQRKNSTGHRPTWKIGTSAGRPDQKPQSPDWIQDPFRLFSETDGDAGPRKPQRKLPKQVQDAFFTLNLDPSASPERIKARYKELVKKFHPDANRGQKGFEERLKRIIEAYQNLRSAGFC